MMTDRAISIATAALLSCLVIASAVLDHVLFGVLGAGRVTLDVAGHAALAGVILAVVLLLLLIPSLAALRRLVQRNGRSCWRISLLALFTLVGQLAWCLAVYAVLWDEPPLDRHHLMGYAAGTVPVGLGAWFAARRLARTPGSPRGWRALATMFAVVFHGIVAWLYPLYPAGATAHMVYNSAAAGLLASLVVLALALVLPARRVPRWAVIAMSALTLLCASLFVVRYRDSFECRDGAARGGRFSRTLLRYTQFLLRPNGLSWLATRATPAPPELGRSLVATLAGEQNTVPSGVIIVTMDATRLDALSSSAPIQKFAGESLRFTRHHAPAPGTRESMTTMFTGRWFWTEESEAEPSLLARLHDAGFRTIVVGYASGPNQYVKNDAFASSVDDLVERPVDNEVPHAATIVDALLTKLDAVGDKPFFAWGHCLDPHFPYVAAGASRRERYQREVDRTAEEIARLVQGVEQRGLSKRTMVIVTADHGEEFQEHGNGYHNLTLYEEVLRVPLLIRLPGSERGREVHDLTSGRDLASAISTAAGVAGRDGAQRGQPVFAFTAVVPGAANPVGVAAVVRGRYKLIYEMRLRSAELYDLEADPTEQVNLVDRQPAIAAALADDLRAELLANGVRVD